MNMQSDDDRLTKLEAEFGTFREGTAKSLKLSNFRCGAAEYLAALALKALASPGTVSLDSLVRTHRIELQKRRTAGEDVMLFEYVLSFLENLRQMPDPPSARPKIQD